jgi:hypothetical protein
MMRRPSFEATQWSASVRLQRGVVMNAVVIYESIYGNTREVAQTVAEV